MGEKSVDPIAESLDRLNDPALWHTETGVPVFRPHVRRDRDGNVLYTVTDEDIPVIARNTAELEYSLTFPPHTIGHRNDAKDADETLQPPVVGYCRNYRLGAMPDGTPAVVCDIQTYIADWPLVRKYPFRSAEYRSKSQTIRCVARLIRDPLLDLGTLVYHAGPDPAFFYSFGAESMADDTKPTDDKPPEEKPAAPAEGGTPEFTPEESKQADRVYSYFCKKYAWMGDSAQKYDAGAAAGGNTFVPTDKVKPTKDDDMADKNEATELNVKYAALETQHTAAESRLASLIAEREAEKVERLLDTLEKVECYQFDRVAEAGRMIPLSTDERKKRADEIRKFHHKLPGSDKIQVYQGNVEGPIPETSRELSNAAVRYATKHGVSYDDGLAKVKAGAS